MDKVKEHWNSHHIGGSRYDTVKGRHSELFYLSELHNTEHFLAPFSAQQCDYITENYLALAESTNEYQDRRVPAYKPGKHWLTIFFIEILQKIAL